MSIKTTEAKLYYALYDFFEKEGFSLLMDKKQFRVNTAAGFKNIIFLVSDYEDGAWLEVHIGCRNEQVEQTAQQFLNVNSMDFRPDANTLIISTGQYNDVKYFRYKIKDEDDLVATCESVKDFLMELGFDFLNTIAHLADVDRLLNSEPLKPCKYLYNQVHRCFKGLIAAKFNDNPRYQYIEETYRKYLAKFANEIECSNYERLVVYLKYYGSN